MAKGQVDIKVTEPASPPPPPEPDQDDDHAQEALAALSAEERDGLGLNPAAEPAPAPEPDPAQAPATEPAAEAPPQTPEPALEPAPDPAAAPAAPAEGTGEAPAAEPAAEPEGEQITVPLARLNQVLDGRRADREEIARLSGLVEGLKSHTPTTQAPQAPQPTPQDRLAQIGAAKTALDAKFETGEDMTTAEYVKQRSELDQRRTDVLLEIQRTSLAPQPAPATPPADDAYLESQTDQLEETYPYLSELSPSDMDYIGKRVLDQAAAEGKPIDTRTAAGVLRWRTEAAKMSNDLGPALTGKTLQPAGTAQPDPNAPAPTPAQGAGQSDAAQARAAKLELQGRMPPDTAQIGSGADKTGLTGSDLIARAEKDPASLEDIPAAELDKFLQ